MAFALWNLYVGNDPLHLTRENVNLNELDRQTSIMAMVRNEAKEEGLEVKTAFLGEDVELAVSGDAMTLAAFLQDCSEVDQSPYFIGVESATEARVFHALFPDVDSEIQ